MVGSVLGPATEESTHPTILRFALAFVGTVFTVFSAGVCLLTSLRTFLCHFEPATLPSLHPVSRGGSMADAWHGPTLSDETLAFGPLAQPHWLSLGAVLFVVASRQRMVDSGEYFFRHCMTPMNVCGNRQQPHV